MSGTLSGTRVLVTGASGFLGGRLAERLVVQCGARVRVLVRRVMSAAPLARFPVEIVVGDISDPSTVAAAAAGCTVIFNCAKGKGSDAALRRAVDVNAVRHLIDAARCAGARVVHVSTMAVYDLPHIGMFDETTPSAPKGDSYSDAKLEGEQLALDLGAHQKVPVTVIQPTVVYGPNAGIHGIEIFEELRAGRAILVNGGDGICNALYVDDAVTALLLAATSDRAAGERFLVSGPEHPTWCEFFAAFEQMLGVKRTIALSEEDALALWRQSRRRKWLVPEVLRAVRENRDLRRRLLATKEGVAARSVAERVLPPLVAERLRGTTRASHTRRAQEDELPIGAVRPWVIRYLARKAHARTDKARELLGYQPVFTLAQGMRLTEQWARWAGLVPKSDTSSRHGAFRASPP